MTANAEARSLLDQLMGADRNALLPAGAALPRKSKRLVSGDGSGGMILPGSKRSKSCYDRDIDPLFCAWGVDVYELFVNTKSDIGPNPFVIDNAARKEYISLSREEKERLGFEYHLFAKLQELVQQSDRTVSKNNEKLKRELQRQSAKRGGNDYVLDVSDEKVEEVVRAELQFEEMKEEYNKLLIDLTELQNKEEEILEQQRKEKEQKEKDKVKQKDNENNVDSEMKIKKDEKDGNIVLDYNGVEPPKEEQDSSCNENNLPDEPSSDGGVLEELGRLALKKQNLLFQIANIISMIGLLEESIEVQHLKLNFVRSDTTTDKLVCEVSGNFMSARDADERIAAHYAGKQYVGWKLVRDKFQEMIKKYGRYGPPRPHARGSSVGAPLMPYASSIQQRGGGDRRSSRSDGRWERGGYRGQNDNFDRRLSYRGPPPPRGGRDYRDSGDYRPRRDYGRRNY